MDAPEYHEPAQHKFVFPHTKQYPIHTEEHAKRSMAESIKSGDAEAVHAAVYSRYPHIAHAHAMAAAMKKAHKEGSKYEEKHESKKEAIKEGD